MQFFRKFTHLSGAQFTGKKMRWRPKNDKDEVWEVMIVPPFPLKGSNIFETYLTRQIQVYLQRSLLVWTKCSYTRQGAYVQTPFVPVLVS